MNVNSVQSSTFGGQTTPAVHAVKKGYKILVDSTHNNTAKNAVEKALFVAPKRECAVKIGDRTFTLNAPLAAKNEGSKGINILA